MHRSPFECCRALSFATLAIVGAACGQHSSFEANAFVADASVSTPSPTPRGFTVQSDGYAAEHRLARYRSHVDARGASIEGAEFRGAIRFSAIGRALQQRTLAEVSPKVVGDRIDLERNETHEWFAHDDRGLEHGFELTRRPEGAGELLLEVEVEGLTPSATSDGLAVELRDPRGRAVLRYGELIVTDATGRRLSSTMSASSSTITLHVEDEGAAYPIAIDPLLMGVQQAKLTVAGTSGQQLGAAVSIGGGTVVVGAPQHVARTGGAFVFVQTGSTWSQQAELAPSDGPAPVGQSYGFGSAVAIDADTIAVGAFTQATSIGAVYVYTRTSGVWTQQAKLLASDAATFSRFGSSVALSGDTLLVGASLKGSSTGAAYVFTRTGSVWTQQALLSATDTATGADFGASVALAGNTALVGADGASGGGRVYVFTRSATTWTQSAELAPSDSGTSFGSSVALDSATALIGSPGAMAAYVFVGAGSAWAQQAKLTPSSASDTTFGHAVAIHGDTALSGMYSFNQVFVFARSGTSWAQQNVLTSSDATAGHQFGAAVATTPSIAVVGAPVASAAYTFVPALTLGSTCTTGAECISGNCIEGVCCDSICGATCSSCLASRTGGSSGTCAFVSNLGADPACPATMCVAAGAGPAACDGAGHCAPKSPSSCGLFRCNTAATACNTTCTTDLDCDFSAYCVTATGTCTTRKANGLACAVGDECKSLQCVDGACCDSACAGRCQACDVGGSVGKCTTLFSGQPHGARTACGDASTCSAQCDGSSPTACGAAPGVATVCATPSCAAGIATAASLCDGAGKCVAGATATCAPFVCGATACKTTCTANADCVSGDYCNGTLCQPALTLGSSCTAAEACASGACTDGVCCSVASCGAGATCKGSKPGTCTKSHGSACSAGTECDSGECWGGVCCQTRCGGQCEACNLPGSPGTCQRVIGAPGSGKPSCNATDTAICARTQCDGVVADHCAGIVNGPTVECLPAGCSSDHGTALSASRCDGHGACAGPTKSSCAPFVCVAGVCQLSCASATDCVAGFACDGKSGKCTPAATCSSDGASMVVGGVTTPCSPYVCSGGACKDRCGGDSDCVTGFQCNGGVCVVPTTASSGGCSTSGDRTGSETSSAGVLVALIAAAAIAQRARKTLRT